MKTPCYDTVILSDLHLGSEVSRAEAALQMLKAVSFSRLILLGDIFCDLNFRRLKKEHWQFLGYIRKLSNPKRGITVVWVEGNHDHGLSDVMSHLVGIDVYQQYEWDFEGVHHLAIHGHQFDRFLVSNRLLSNIFTAFHDQLQKVSFGRKRIVNFLEAFRYGLVTSFQQSGVRGFGLRQNATCPACLLRSYPRSDAGQKGRSRVFQQWQLDSAKSHVHHD